tara:strand:- start:363 stop:965 length:603 start_codon:yes stop_codon:yes gene_type:complete
MTISRLSALLLSAGLSSRINPHKAFLDWRGTPLLASQVTCLNLAGFSEIIVVLGYEYKQLARLVPNIPNVKIAINDSYITGQTSSIKHGISYLSPETDGVMIVAVDQPRNITTHQIMSDHLSERHTIITPSYKGIPGHPVLFHKSLINDLLSIEESSKGLKQILIRHASMRFTVDINDPLIPININTMDDYQSALSATES